MRAPAAALLALAALAAGGPLAGADGLHLANALGYANLYAGTLAQGEVHAYAPGAPSPLVTLTGCNDPFAWTSRLYVAAAGLLPGDVVVLRTHRAWGVQETALTWDWPAATAPTDEPRHSCPRFEVEGRRVQAQVAYAVLACHEDGSYCLAPP